jgi:hypothetical protein
LALSPTEIRDKIFAPLINLAEPLYDKGARAVAEQVTPDKAAQDKFVNDASLLSILSKENHDKVGGFVWIGLLLVLLLAAAAAYFSHGFGRLVTPAVALLAVSLPALIIFSMLRAWLSQPPDDGATEDISQALLAARGALEPLASTGQQVYLTAIGVAGGLLLMAILGRVGYTVYRRYKKLK